MKIVFFSDTHNERPNIPACDLAIYCGDCTTGGYQYELRRFLEYFQIIDAPYKIFIAGNHDFICQKQPDQVRELAAQHGITYLCAEHIDIHGIKIWGSPYTPWFNNWAFNFPRNDFATALNHWNKIPLNTNIVITHGPPHMIGDQVLRPRPGEGPHVGCPHLARSIKLVEPHIHAFGHIHEGYGKYQLSDHRTTYLNVSHMNRYYSPTNPPVVIDYKGTYLEKDN